MVTVPTMGGAMYQTDPQAIIAYTLNMYFHTPANAVPLFGDAIISLPYQVARFGKEPDTLATNISADLRGCLTRIFGAERQVSVSTNYTSDDSGNVSMTITVTYTRISGDLDQTAGRIYLKPDGSLGYPDNSVKLG